MKKILLGPVVPVIIAVLSVIVAWCCYDMNQTIKSQRTELEKQKAANANLHSAAVLATRLMEHDVWYVEDKTTVSTSTNGVGVRITLDVSLETMGDRQLIQRPTLNTPVSFHAASPGLHYVVAGGLLSYGYRDRLD